MGFVPALKTETASQGTALPQDPISAGKRTGSIKLALTESNKSECCQLFQEQKSSSLAQGRLWLGLGLLGSGEPQV